MVEFEPIVTFPDPPESDDEKHFRSANKALIAVAHDAPCLLALQVTRAWEEALNENFSIREMSDLLDASVEAVPDDDTGMFVFDVGFIDDGPGDWPGSRETTPSFTNPRRVTAQEWSDFLAGDWFFDVPKKTA